MNYLVAGLLLGFASAYVAHVPLTVGKIAILAAFGILILANGLVLFVWRDIKTQARISKDREDHGW